MVSEEIYDLCVPILQNLDLNEEDQVEKIEEVIKEKTSLTGSPRENAVLDILWRHRGSTKPGTTPPVRHKVIRKTSPAAWQLSRTPSTTSQSRSNTSPAPPPGLPVSRPSFPKSSTVSPFTSPRPSPRLALAQHIPHSPSLNAYQFSDPSTQAADNYGDLGQDNVDWLVNDDVVAAPSRPNPPSVASSVTSLSAAAPEFQPPPRMNPYDTLRSVLGDRKTDEEISASLEANGYDLAATMAALTEGEGEQMAGADSSGRILVGKSMSIDQSRPHTPSNARSSIVCKYYSTTGQCLRADCRFSHDLTTHICKYWIKGACLAGDGCSYSHDPAAVAGLLNANNGSSLGISGSPGGSNSPHRRPLRNGYDSFPTSQSPGMEQWASPLAKHASQVGMQGGSPYRVGSPSNGPNIRHKNAGINHATHRFSQTNSRPSSRHQNREPNASSLSVDDPDAFPTLSSTNTRAPNRKPHTKKAHNKDIAQQKENNAGSLNAIKVSSSPTPSPRRPASKLNNNQNSRVISTDPEKVNASLAIPTPKNVPWFDEGPRYKEYITYRRDAIAYCNEKLSFHQSANMMRARNNYERAAQMERDGEWHWERGLLCYNLARQHLYDLKRSYYETPQSLEDDVEVYVDLHSLHPDEALEYIEPILWRQKHLGRLLVYVITGTSYTKNHKDKVAKAVKNWLNSWGYVFREFSMNGENPCYSAVGVLGVDPASHEQKITGNAHEPVTATTTETVAPVTGARKKADAGYPTDTAAPGKIQLLKRETGKQDATTNS